MEIKLRDYQVNIISKVREAFRQGSKRVCLCMPCGAGKTICFAYMSTQRKCNTFFIAHRQELVEQAKSVFPTEVPSNIYIGMVGTCIKNAPFEPELIFIDECHHATANTYRRIIEAYPNAYVIGLTATPCRLDGSGLGQVFDCIVQGVESEWLIDNGYLAPYKYYAPPVSVMSPKIKFGEFDVGSMEYESKIYGDIKKYITDERTIIYCPNIAFSKAIAEQVGGVHFDGDTPKSERNRIISEFRSGKIKILCNVDLIGEGFDVPDCSRVILLRPTMSLSLFIQQSMRCMRYAPNKVATIIDCVGNVHRHGLPTNCHEWTLCGKIPVRNRDGEPDVVVRMCKSCFRVYEGNSRICPYCQAEQPKTKREIKLEQEAELEEIKKAERREVGRARDINTLVEIGRKRGYKNPYAWARYVMNGRNCKI